MKDDDIELATKQICSKRLELDDLIASIEGVQFFVSCITAVTSNPKTSGGETSGNSNEGKVYPAIAFFIVYRESSMCNETTLFRELHKRDVDVTISTIATRAKGSNAMEKAARQLIQVVKDHKNEMVLQMCEESNNACYATSAATSDEGESSQPITHPIHYPIRVE